MDSDCPRNCPCGESWGQHVREQVITFYAGGDYSRFSRSLRSLDVVTLALRTLGDLPLAQRSADRLVADHGIDEDAAYALRLAIEELGSNVIRHGFSDREVHDISLRITVEESAVELTVEDDGRPFDPSQPRHLDTPASLEDAPTGGMGLLLGAQIAGPLQYRRINGRNRTTRRRSRTRDVGP